MRACKCINICVHDSFMYVDVCRCTHMLIHTHICICMFMILSFFLLCMSMYAHACTYLAVLRAEGVDHAVLGPDIEGLAVGGEHGGGGDPPVV